MQGVSFRAPLATEPPGISVISKKSIRPSSWLVAASGEDAAQPRGEAAFGGLDVEVRAYGCDLS